MRLSILIFLALVPLTHADTAPEIAAKAKRAYLGANWEQFFGLAAYARQNLPAEKASAEVLLLEGLGLLRHCQWAAAGRIFEHGKKGKFLVADFETASRLVPLEPSTQTPSRGIEARQYWWPITSASARNPHQLRRRVKNLCREAAQ